MRDQKVSSERKGIHEVTSLPLNLIAAVTHPDPYPYYARLVAETPLYYDAGLGMWVASSADAVTAVLTSGLCGVRPASEPVPRVLLGTPAERLFGNLVRMNDGERHHAVKAGVSAVLADARDVALHAQAAARITYGELQLRRYRERLSAFAFRLPVYAVAAALGVPRNQWAQAAIWLDTYVRGLAPGSTAEQVEGCARAAVGLLGMVESMLKSPRGGTLLAAMAGAVASRDALVANSVGLMIQTYEATAGLIGLTLLALARDETLRARVYGDASAMDSVVREVARWDAPIQNTRRWLARDGMVAGQAMREGDRVLVVLAAANRDPKANADPQRFDNARTSRRSYTFGVGVHACPGEDMASAIASAGVAYLVAAGLDWAALRETVTYRPSHNARIPLFYSA